MDLKKGVIAMTDLKTAKAALDAKRREKSKLDAECEALERKIESEKAAKEVGKKLEPAMGMLLSNRALRDELAKYSVRESRIILQALLGAPALAESFRTAAREAEPQLAKLREKAERDRQRRAGRKTAPEARQTAQQQTVQQQTVQQQTTPQTTPQQAARQATGPAVVQAPTQGARPVAVPAAQTRTIPAPGLRTIPAPRPQG